MTATSVAPALGWRLATISAIREETSSARTLVLDVHDWPGHVPGQHVKVRLLPGEEDRIERSFSIVSPPDEQRVSLTIERLPAGKVSGRLCGDVQVGYQFEISGPLGTRFLWRAIDGGPLLLVAGGSGIAPLMAMLRHRAHFRQKGEPARELLGGARLLYSAQSWDRVIYREELARLVAQDPSLEVTYAITRSPKAGRKGYTRRIDRAMLEEVAWRPSQRPRNYVCGPNAFVETAANALAGGGHDPATIFTERFGPTGT